MTKQFSNDETIQQQQNNSATMKQLSNNYKKLTCSDGGITRPKGEKL